MSSFLWLLFYLAPLLGITAALFAWFGWRWRGSDMHQRISQLATPGDATSAALHPAEIEIEPEKDEAQLVTPDPPAITLSAEPQAPDITAAELQALRADLQSAQATARQHQEEARLRQAEAAQAREAAQNLESKVTRLTQELAQLQTEHTTAQAELAGLRSARPAADITAPEPPPPVDAASAKPKRKRGTTARSARPASDSGATLHEKITALETQLARHEAGLAPLTQERDDWQRRILKLEGRTPADPAALALAHRSLADSEKRLATATTEIERLQNQTRVLRRVEQASAALPPAAEDDLTQIKGIKKVISEQLRAHGIRTWRQIALWDEAEQRAFSELLAFKNRAAREQWQEQARALHEAAHGPLV